MSRDRTHAPQATERDIRQAERAIELLEEMERAGMLPPDSYVVSGCQSSHQGTLRST